MKRSGLLFLTAALAFVAGTLIGRPTAQADAALISAVQLNWNPVGNGITETTGWIVRGGELYRCHRINEAKKDTPFRCVKQTLTFE